MAGSELDAVTGALSPGRVARCGGPEMTRPRRHPSEVTVDRLHAVLDEYSEEMDGATLDAFGLVIFALDNIAQGEKP